MTALPASHRSSNTRWLTAGALACCVAIGAAWPSLPPGVRNWDNVVKLQVAANFVLGRGFVLTAPTPADEFYVMRGRDGRAYTGYLPLAYVLQLPVLALAEAGRVPVEGVPPLLLLGLTAWVLVAWARRAGVSPAAAAAGALLACFGTALWPSVAHGYDVLIEVLALAVILWASAGERRLDWLVAGLAVGAAFATRLGAMLLAVPALVLLLAQRKGGLAAFVGRGAAFAAGCLPGILLVAWFDWVRFGSPFVVGTTTAAGSANPGELMVPWFSREHLEAIAGLTVSPGKGIVWYGPPLIGVLCCLRPLWRRHAAVLASLGAYLAVGLASFGRFLHWHSEWAWGPRYLAPLYVAAAPLVWWAWGELRSRRLASRVAGLALGVALMALQAIPVGGYPVEVHFGTTLRRLQAQGALVTRPITGAPVPADNGVLYFRAENSMMVSVVRNFVQAWDDPGPSGAHVRHLVTLAMLVPLLSLALVLSLDRLPRRETAVPPVEDASGAP